MMKYWKWSICPLIRKWWISKVKPERKNITVSTNAPTWEAKADKNWCTLSVAGKILKVSVDESEERLVREATITITAEGQKKMVKVRQLGYEAAILIDTNVFEVEVIGKEITF